MTPKLLLADDSVTIQRVIELTFADENVQVVAVGDGREALDRLQSDPPDIVLADVGMPERDGYEVAEFIKRDPRLAHIPVLLLTGAFEPVDDARAKAIGCDGVLVKPFEPQMVINRVRELLSGARSAAPAASTTSPAAEAPSAMPGAPAAHQVRVSAAQEPGPDNSLEDYFDRLDAALANLGPPAPDPVEPLAGPAVEAPRQSVPSLPARTEAAAIETPAGVLPPLHAAFSALLAAERGEPVDIPLPVPEPLSEAAIEDIVSRVIARMDDARMRALVLDTAERLVREEIDRIKRQA